MGRVMVEVVVWRIGYLSVVVVVVVWALTEGGLCRHHRGHVQSPDSGHQLHIGIDSKAGEGESAEVFGVHRGGFQKVGGAPCLWRNLAVEAWVV